MTIKPQPARVLFSVLFLVGTVAPLTAATKPLTAAPSKPLKTDSSARCAAYGPGYFAAEGTQTCLKVGGRVRVEYRWTSQRH
jgi:hypothetical protein